MGRANLLFVVQAMHLNSEDVYFKYTICGPPGMIKQAHHRSGQIIGFSFLRPRQLSLHRSLNRCIHPVLKPVEMMSM